MSTVSIQKDVNITPGVIAAGGSGFALTAMFLTTSSRVPIGTALFLGTTAAVAAYFGSTSLEARAAQYYFAGFDNSNKKPGTLGFTQYNTANVGAYLRGGSLAALTLTQLQALSGTLAIVLDGVSQSGSPNLSGATSFSNAAQIIGAALALYGPQSATFTGAISSTTLTASGVTGSIDIGGKIAGSGVTAGTYIVAQLTGTPNGAGTYQVSASQTVGSVAMTGTLAGVTFDSVSSAFKAISPTTGAASSAAYATGAISANLALTLATGAVLSQGANAQTSPSAFMTSLVGINNAFASFALLFNPDNSGNDIRYAFAVWAGLQNNRYVYQATDSDASPTTTVPAPTSLAQRVSAASISGVVCNWQLAPTDPLDYADLSAFVCGTAASLDFTQTNGRATFDFRSQSGMIVSVTDDTTHDNLLANGYNFYQVEANGGDIWRSYANGSISGSFLWQDSFYNQIAMNGAFTSALRNLLQTAYSIPYNAPGRTLIETSLQPAIEQFLNYGAFRAGVALSASQIAAVNNRAGKNISDTLINQGWYLDVGVANSTVRQARGSPPMTFYYVDGQSVQHFDMASISIL